jgi:cytochrome c5
MKHRLFVVAALICLGSVCVNALAQTSAPSPPKDSKPSPARASQGSPADGEKRFQTNCGRCHNPPEDISPREARAVVRHMRVRAMLSAEDEKLILEYLEP